MEVAICAGNQQHWKSVCDGKDKVLQSIYVSKEVINIEASKDTHCKRVCEAKLW